MFNLFFPGNLVIFAVHGLYRHRPVMRDPTAFIIYESDGRDLLPRRTWFASDALPQLKASFEAHQSTSLAIGPHHVPHSGYGNTEQELEEWKKACAKLFSPAFKPLADQIFIDLLAVKASEVVDLATFLKPLVFGLYVRPSSAAYWPPTCVDKWTLVRQASQEEHFT